MATNPNPYDDSYPWNHIVIGGVTLPGIIEDIDGCGKPHRWVFQMGLAVSNSVSVWRGQKLAESIKIRMRLYDKASFDGTYSVRNALQPKLGYKPPALPVMNGAFNFVGITRVSVANIPAPKAAPSLTWTWDIELIEFNPMKPVPVGAQDPPKAETENDRLQKRFSALLAEASKL